MAAGLEDFVRDFIDEIAAHINGANVSVADLKLGVVSLLEAPRFDSIAAGRRQEMWSKRAELLSAAASHGPAALSIGMRPLDGRTIKQEHLDSLWTIYGLPGAPLPGPLHALALRDLSEGRNQVAHGNIDPITFGRSRTHYDVMRRIEQMEDIAMHVAEAGARYVSTRGYLR